MIGIAALASVGLSMASDSDSSHGEMWPFVPGRGDLEWIWNFEEGGVQYEALIMPSVADNRYYTWHVRTGSIPQHRDHIMGDEEYVFVTTEFNGVHLSKAREHAMWILELLRDFDARWRGHEGEYKFLEMLRETPFSWMNKQEMKRSQNPDPEAICVLTVDELLDHHSFQIFWDDIVDFGIIGHTRHGDAERSHQLVEMRPRP